MGKRELPTIKIKDAKIKYRNFRGAEQNYNPEGRRTFTLVIRDHEMAKILKNDGWNVRFKENKTDPDMEPEAQLKVRVNYKGPFPPVVRMRTESSDYRDLTEENIGQLDTAEIVTLDLEIRPYEWETPGSSGVSAYLKKMDVTIEDDDIRTGYGEYSPL